MNNTPPAFAPFVDAVAALLVAHPSIVAQKTANALIAAKSKTWQEGKYDSPWYAKMNDFFAETKAENNSLFAKAADISPFLSWRAAINGKIPTLGVAEILGPTGTVACEESRAGLFFQPANMFYSWHKHAAEEIYLPIYGTATWFVTGKPPAVIPPAGECIHHLSQQAHAMQTTETPVLALWGWHGDLDFNTYAFCEEE